MRIVYCRMRSSRGPQTRGKVPLQGHDRLGHDPFPFCLVMGLQDIHRTRVRGVRGVEEHHVLDPFLWNSAKDRLQQIAVGIEQADAVPGGNVLQD